jgi:hypothetical protein
LPLSRRRIVSLAAAGALLGIAGCGPTAEVPPTQTPAATPTAADLLAMASQRLGEIPTVHFALAVEGETFIDSAKTIRLLGAEGDLVRPDRVQTTFQAEVLGRAITIQLISIGTRSWTTNILTGDWGEAPVEFAYRPDILFSTQDGIGPVMGRVENVTRLADEEISGRAAYHLTATVDESVVGPLTYYTLHGSPVTVDLWIDQETHDLLMARMSEPKDADRPHPAVWTLTLSHHGQPFAIEPPELPAPKATPA